MMMDGRVEKWLLNLGWTGRSRLSHPVCQVYERRSLGSANAFRGSRRTSQCALKTLKKCRDDTRATSTSPFQIQRPLFNSSVHHHAGHVPPLDASSFNGQHCFQHYMCPKISLLCTAHSSRSVGARQLRRERFADLNLQETTPSCEEPKSSGGGG